MVKVTSTLTVLFLQGRESRILSCFISIKLPLRAPIPPVLSTDYQTLCRWAAQYRLCASRALIHHHGNVRLQPCGCCSWKWKYYLYFHHWKQPLINRKPFFKPCLPCRVKWKSWFVQLGEASPLLAWLAWPVLGWKNRTDLHETQHTINGHLSWITHFKMSTRLQAATLSPPPFPVLGERRCRVTVRKPRQLWCMHASFMDWQQHTHTENDCRKTVTL